MFTIGKRVSWRRSALLTVVTLGTGLSIATDFETTAAGVFIAAVWLPLSAALKVSWAAAEKEDGWETLPLLYKLVCWSVSVLECTPPRSKHAGMIVEQRLRFSTIRQRNVLSIVL